MKKINLLLLTLFLFACSPTLKGIGKYEFLDRNGEKQEVSVVLEMKDDKISSISIDETYIQDGEKTTKKRLGAAYGMKEVEGSKGEWNEQIKHLEMELIGTDGDIELNEEGYPTDEDITSGCTINLANIEKGIQNAISNAGR